MNVYKLPSWTRKYVVYNSDIKLVIRHLRFILIENKYKNN